MPLGNAEFHVMDKKQTLYEIQNLDAEYVHPRSDLLIWYGADVLPNPDLEKIGTEITEAATFFSERDLARL